MEAGFLNFHDEGHFSDFSILDQSDLLENPVNSLIKTVNEDFDYLESEVDQNGLWDTEQEFNGDIAILPVSGVSSTFPKVENISEDFAKVLNDWQDHIGLLQTYEIEQDIAALVMDPPATASELPENIFEDDVLIELNPQTTLKRRKSDMLNKKRSPIKALKSIVSEAEMQEDEKVEEIDIAIKQEIDDMKSLSEENWFDEPSLPSILEAGDVTSLLEQFEASEVVSDIINQREKFKRDETKGQKLEVKKEETEDQDCVDIEKEMQSQKILLTSKANRQKQQTSRQTVESSKMKNQRVMRKMSHKRRNPPEKCLESGKMESHTQVQNSLPKEVIDRIKASGRKRSIPVIPALPDKVVRRKKAKMDNGLMIARNKNSYKNGSIDTSIFLDHDYCINSNSSNLKSTIESSKHHTVIKVECAQISSNGRDSSNNYIAKDLSIVDLIDSKKEVFFIPDLKSIETSAGNAQKIEIYLTNTTVEKRVENSVLDVNEVHSKKRVQCILASKTRGKERSQKMVSVLKKPPQSSKPLVVVPTKPNESIVTTTDSSNNTVQNIIIQNTAIHDNKEELMKTQRKKLNLAEYRSRREQKRGDSSILNSPIQPMTLVYINHASTTTKPIERDSRSIWSEREIVSVLKPKCGTECKKSQLKSQVKDAYVQTIETVSNPIPKYHEINVSSSSNKAFEEIQEEKEERQAQNSIEVRHSSVMSEKVEINAVCSVKKFRENDNFRVDPQSSHRYRNYKRRRDLSRSSLSRSRSRSSSTNRRDRNRDRTRSRKRRISSRAQSRSRSRSRSRKYIPERRRRISRRRSSVSSNSSWSSRSYTKSSSSFRTRSSRSRSRSYRLSRSRSRSRSPSQFSGCSRSSSHSYRRQYDGWYDKEKQRQVEERRVIYVGRLEEGISKAELRRRFEAFGPVVDISLHFREHGDNYGFVTFAYKNDAYQAVEHGNDDPTVPRYDLCFGGRRAFCKVKYADLDGMATNSYGSRNLLQSTEGNTFDLLLKEAQAKLRKRKA